MPPPPDYSTTWTLLDVLDVLHIHVVRLTRTLLKEFRIETFYILLSIIDCPESLPTPINTETVYLIIRASLEQDTALSVRIQSPI